jgi:antitoxin component YwqK of YwqJK toxin-antitoxin module
MRIIITEEQKKKLFIPRKLSDDDSRYSEWNNKQPIVDGKRINQYDGEGNKIGYWEEYYDNDKLESKGNYVNGKKEGYWEEEYDYGEVNAKGNYINDKKDGYWEYYWDTGELFKQGTYKDGKKDGIWEEYFKDGEFWYKGEYKNGKYIKDIEV